MYSKGKGLIFLKRSDWIALSIYAFFLIASVFGILLVLAFPENRFVVERSGGDVAPVIAGLAMSATIISVLFFVTFSIARQRVRAAFILSNACEYNDTATVIAKTSQVYGNFFATETEYHISFEFSNKQRRSFSVEATQHNLIAEGETGLLTYKQFGEHFFFVSFQPTTF